MKKRLRSGLFAAFAFLVLVAFYPGFSLSDSKVIVFASFVYALLYLFVRPILKIFSLPLNLITFGFFSLFVNFFVLYILTNIVSEFKIIAFSFDGIKEINWVLDKSVEINSLYSGIIGSLLLSFVTSFFYWLFD